MNSKRAAAWLCVMLSGVGGAQAQTEPSDWLVRAAKAAEQTNFMGTVVLHRDGKSRTMQIYQGFDGQQAHQRLVTLSGEECEVLRRADESSVVFPRRRVLIHGHRSERNPIPKIPHDAAFLKQHYELALEGRERVADRECVLVTAMPRDMYRYGCTLCVDTVTSLPLRVQMRVPGRELVELFAFTTLKVLESMDEFEPDTFRVGANVAGYSRVGMPYGVMPAVQPWQARNLPPGFKQRLSVVRRLPRNGTPVQHMVLADPLSQVSVFIEPPSPTNPLRNRMFRHWTHNGYQMMRHGHRITVFGGVPATTVRMIGDSLIPQP